MRLARTGLSSLAFQPCNDFRATRRCVMIRFFSLACWKPCDICCFGRRYNGNWLPHHKRLLHDYKIPSVNEPCKPESLFRFIRFFIRFVESSVMIARGHTLAGQKATDPPENIINVADFSASFNPFLHPRAWQGVSQADRGHWLLGKVVIAYPKI